MNETDKIVAAILTAAYSFKDQGIINPGDLVSKYNEILAKLEESAKDASAIPMVAPFVAFRQRDLP
jgi:hypothetical protein